MPHPAIECSSPRAPSRLAPLVLLLLGCPAGSASDDAAASTTGGSGSPHDDGDESGTTGGGEPGVLVGSFQLQLTEPKPASGGTPATPGTTSLVGKVYDGPTPQTIVWEPGTEEGPCRLSTPRVPFCSTPCGGSAACVEDETCQDYPSALSVGDVLVTGVATTAGATSFTMTPIASNYQPPAGTSLAYPAFAEGDAITLAAAGDALDAFELSAAGVAPLVLDQAPLVLDPASDLQLAWTPGATDSTIAVTLDISHHGGTKGLVECEADDTGSLAISAVLVAELLDLGVAGYPSIVVTRRATGSATTAAGRVDLVVSSQVEREVVIEGLVSCTDDTDCPDGQACQTDLQCQ